MHYVSRSNMIQNKLDEFLESSETSTNMDLYSKEVRRMKRDYGSEVEVEVGDKTRASREDRRYNCIIRKK